MSNLPYIENEVTEMIEYIIDVEELLESMRHAGLTEYNTGDYNTDCVDMCNIMTYAIGKRLLPFCEASALIVHEGVFGMIGNHTWLEVEDAIIDGTLGQFVTDAKPLCFLDKDFEEYHKVRTYMFEEWLETSPNIME